MKQVNFKEELIGEIIDVFEDFLTDKGVEIENDARDECMCEDDTQPYVNIFGEDYDVLADAISNILELWHIPLDTEIDM